MTFQTKQVGLATISSHKGNLKPLDEAVVTLRKDLVSAQLSLHIASTQKIENHLVHTEIEFPFAQFERAQRRWTGNDLERTSEIDLYFMGHIESLPRIVAFLTVKYYENVWFKFRGIAWHCHEDQSPVDSNPTLFVPVDDTAAYVLMHLQDLALV
jgi:hypothetical protein